MRLRIVTYNIHKGVMGVRGFKKQVLTIHALREQLHALKADLIFLQEVQGRHDVHENRFEQWPQDGQHEFLSVGADLSALDEVMGHASQRYFNAYGMNAVYPHGHHGNALLSVYPIDWFHNEDVSDHRLEKRGLLHCSVQTPKGPVYALVAHLGLFRPSRRRQAQWLVEHAQRLIPPDAPLIVAGDFNDWQRVLGPQLEAGLSMTEVFPHASQDSWLKRRLSHGSFPCRFPILGLDRVFCRGFQVINAQVLGGAAWAHLSDHAPFVVDLEWHNEV